MLRPVLLPILEPVLHFGLTSYRGGGGPAPWSPADLFAAAEPGSWIDPSDPETLYPTRLLSGGASTLDTPVGAALDKRLWGGASWVEVLAGKPELLSDPGFDNPAAWTASPDNTWVVQDSAAQSASTGNNRQCYQPMSYITGETYVTEIDISATTGVVALGPFAGGTQGSAISPATTGIHRAAVAPLAAASRWAIVVNGTVQATIGSAGLKHLPGRMALQTTDAARPMLRQTGGGVWYLDGHAVNAELPVTLPAGTYTRAYVSSTGTVTIEEGVSISGAENVLRVPELAGILYIARALTADEKASLTAYWEART